MRITLLSVMLLAAACSAGTAPADPDPETPSNGSSEGLAPRIGECDIFPADNAWNRDISATRWIPSPTR